MKRIISRSRHMPRRRGSNRRGMLLVVVLVAIAMLSLAGYTFSELMFAEREATWIYGRAAQSQALAESGVELLMRYGYETDEVLVEFGGLYDNPAMFQGVIVADDVDPRRRGRFAVLAPYIKDGYLAGVRFGLENESTRLNLNVLPTIDEVVPDGGRTILMGLPGMTEDVADAILDWIDEDDEPREFGAEVDYYSSLPTPYAPKNGPLDTVEELLLVRDITPYLLFGADANRNLMLDPSEGTAETVEGIDNSLGELDFGWSAYLTLYSQETNIAPDGAPRIDVNGDDLEALYDELMTALGDEEWATFIIVYRQQASEDGGGGQGGGGLGGGLMQVGNQSQGGGGQGGQSQSNDNSGQQPSNLVPEPANGRLPDLTQQGQTRLTSILDLIGEDVEVTFPGEEQPILLQNPFTEDPAEMAYYLPLLMDYLTVNTAATIPGRINLNQASRVVLSGIPGMTSTIVDSIMGSREPETAGYDSPRRHETWLLTEGHVTLDEMRELIPFVTSGGRVYRAHVVGYFDAEGPASRLEVVIDATGNPPRLVLWRDLSHLGGGYDPEFLGTEAVP